MKRFILLLGLLVIVSAPLAKGDLLYYGIEDTIRDDLTVHNVVTLKFNETVSHLDYNLNFEIFNLEAKSDFSRAMCEIKEKKTISCGFEGVSPPDKSQLTLSFDTIGAVKKAGSKLQFRAVYGFLPTDKMFTLIRLPQFSIFSEENVNNSFSPSDGKIISDGKSISVFWERGNIGQENLDFSVSYIPQSTIPNYLIVLVTALVIVGMVGVGVYARKRKPLQEQLPQQQPAEIITSVLTQDEKTVVDILNRNEGKALQKLLVRESGFSKAKVSRLLKDMKGRNIVEIEPVSGRENRILLTMGEKKGEEGKSGEQKQGEKKEGTDQ